MPEVVVRFGGRCRWDLRGCRKTWSWDPWICLPLPFCGSRWPRSTRQRNAWRREGGSGGEGPGRCCCPPTSPPWCAVPRADHLGRGVYMTLYCKGEDTQPQSLPQGKGRREPRVWGRYLYVQHDCWGALVSSPISLCLLPHSYSHTLLVSVIPPTTAPWHMFIFLVNK